MSLKERGRTGHGGDWAGYEREYGKEALDFSMNVNPMGMPEGVAKAIAGAASKADRYPDPKCRRLRAALAEYQGVPEEWILCGNGAADIIDRIAIAFGRRSRALVTDPAFSEYESSLLRCECSVDHLKLDENDEFEITEDKVDDIEIWLRKKMDDQALVFLCEPNNPTGITTEMKCLEKILGACDDVGGILVVDECFNGFLDAPQEHTLKGYLAEHSDLIILRAFTKIFGMAGVRLGYCLCSDEEKLKKIEDAGQPWNVSYLAEEAGIAALREEEYINETRSIIAAERGWLRNRLEKLGVGRVYGEANYLFFRWPGDVRAKTEEWNDEGAERAGEEGLIEKLKKRGILIRDCSNFNGLEAGWYRVAVRDHAENERLIQAMMEVAGEER